MFPLLAFACYLLFWCSWPESEVDRVATQEASIATAGCQQAYDCSNEGNSDRDCLSAFAGASESDGGGQACMCTHPHTKYVCEASSTLLQC